jgi:hypothetical protein
MKRHSQEFVAPVEQPVIHVLKLTCMNMVGEQIVEDEAPGFEQMHDQPQRTLAGEREFLTRLDADGRAMRADQRY